MYKLAVIQKILIMYVEGMTIEGIAQCIEGLGVDEINDILDSILPNI